MQGGAAAILVEIAASYVATIRLHSKGIMSLVRASRRTSMKRPWILRAHTKCNSAQVCLKLYYEDLIPGNKSEC